MPTETKKEQYGKIHAEWDFPEFTQYDRSIFWYFWVGLIGIILLVYALWTANFLFAIIIGLTTFIIYLDHRHEPENLKFQITEDGLVIGKDFYPYKNLKKFWIIYEPPTVKNLYIDTPQILKKELSIPLGNINPITVRRALLKYLDEDLSQEEESSTDRWARWLKL